MTRRNRFEEGADRYHPRVEHPFLKPVGHAAQAVDGIGKRLELFTSLAQPGEFVLNLPEVVAEPAHVPGPAVNRALVSNPPSGRSCHRAPG